MISKRIIYLPGKNPKPLPEQHQPVLWRALLEGVRRAEPQIAEQIATAETRFELVAWNPLYYHTYKDLTQDLPWIDRIINTHGPSEQDVREAYNWHKKLDTILINIADRLPLLIHLLPKPVRQSAEELQRYFCNTDNIACDIRELLKQQLRDPLNKGDHILIIAHSMGSVIAYDTLWELSHLENTHGKLTLLTIGSPLGLRYIQHRLSGHDQPSVRRYPNLIRHWYNLVATGDMVALDKELHDNFKPMIDLGLVEEIEDHCHGIYNTFRNEEGLNCHRSYGYLVNPAMGELIAQWWKST